MPADHANSEIGEALFISKKTVSVHVANIKGKLGAESRIEIATVAMRSGLIAPPASVRVPQVGRGPG